mgnify:CR=1 FL=1
MASEPTIQYAEKIADLTLNGSVKKGDAVAHNGTNWVQADASDAATNLYAQYIAMQSGVSGNIIKGCKGCVLYDADAPYTANSPLYVSGTAGALTHTRPATAADVIQIVGRAISTTEARIDITPPREVEVFLHPDTYDATSEPGLGVIDNPKWTGPALDSTTTEEVYFTGRFPSGVLSVEKARIVFNSIGETTMTISASLICCADGATNTGDTGTAHATAAPTSIANNKLCYSDVEAMFDADALKAGYNFTVLVKADGSADGNLQAVLLLMRYMVVGDAA